MHALQQGIYTQRKGASPALTLLGPIIDEVPAAPTTHPPASAPRPAASQNGGSAQHAAPQQAAPPAARRAAAAPSDAAERALVTGPSEGGDASCAAGAGALRAAQETAAAREPEGAAQPEAKRAAFAPAVQAAEVPAQAAAQEAQAARPAGESRSAPPAADEPGAAVECLSRASGRPQAAIGPALPPGIVMNGCDGDEDGEHSGATGEEHAAPEDGDGGAAGRADAAVGDGGAGQAEGAGDGVLGADGGGRARVVVGPAVPSAELLRAAAEATEAVRSTRGQVPLPYPYPTLTLPSSPVFQGLVEVAQCFDGYFQSTDPLERQRCKSWSVCQFQWWVWLVREA